MATGQRIGEDTSSHVVLYIGKIPFDPHRLIYATIILMVSLAVYNQEGDAWSGSPLADLAIVVFAPLVALSLAHAFADALDVQIRTGQSLTTKQRRHLLGVAAQYVIVGVPVVALALAWNALQHDPRDVVRFVEIFGVASLSLWGAFAARRSGLSLSRQLRWACTYGLLGFAIVLVEVAFTH